jgi:hypothetical protein
MEATAKASKSSSSKTSSSVLPERKHKLQVQEPSIVICVAPTGRATCKHGSKKEANHAIDKGELKVVTYYQPKSKNHLESTNKTLKCVSVKQAKQLLTGDDKTESGIPIIFNVDDEAKAVAMKILQYIVDYHGIVCEPCDDGVPSAIYELTSMRF